MTTPVIASHITYALLGTVLLMPIIKHYLLASFGWLLYVVGKLWYQRNDFDTNNDGLGWEEVKIYLRLNWISALFSFMLLLVVVPYAREIWVWGMDLSGKDWAFNEFVYVLAGGFILVVQVLVDKFTKKN